MVPSGEVAEIDPHGQTSAHSLGQHARVRIGQAGEFSPGQLAKCPQAGMSKDCRAQRTVTADHQCSYAARAACRARTA